MRRGKAALSSGCKSHPATAPAGSNRSSHGGDEMAEAAGTCSAVNRLLKSVVRQSRTPRSVGTGGGRPPPVTRWMWKRSHGGTIEAPPNERGGNRYVQPTTTAPHLDSTKSYRNERSGRRPLSPVSDRTAEIAGGPVRAMKRHFAEARSPLTRRTLPTKKPGHCPRALCIPLFDHAFGTARRRPFYFACRR